MKKQKGKVIIGLLLVVAVVIAIVVFALKEKAPNYNGLVTKVEVQISDENRTLLEQRVAVNKAAIAGSEGAGQDFDEQLYLQLANDARQLGDLITAREAQEEVLNHNPINLTAWINYGRTLMMMQDYVEAESAFRQVLKLGGGSEAAIRDLYDAVDKQNGDGSRTDELRRVLEVGVEGAGQTPWFMIALGDWYANAGECDKAKDHYLVAKGLVSAEEQKQMIAEAIDAISTTCTAK